MSPAIKIEGLYKEYQLGVIGHGTLYRDMQSWMATLRGKEDPNTVIGQSSKKKVRDKILALNDINLEIRDGEVLGIIGANGAGKSTLLKILSRVTAPTRGRIKVRGRIASLLEVGTGFHPELTGRENIYLNAAINGMNRAEVNSKLDEIVEFAGVDMFLDTPVKRYSSGMQVRLGFAVAAHLEPEILVVDEVLAVGDASFQKKAIGKMQDVSTGEGRTVIFVSHNMDLIKKLCPRSILFDQGILINDGVTNEVIDKYISLATDGVKKYDGEKNWQIDDSPGNDAVKLMTIRTKNEKDEIKSEFDVTETVIIEFIYKVLQDSHQLGSIIEICSGSRDEVFLRIMDDYSRGPWGKQQPKEKGTYKAVCTIPKNYFGEGIKIINLRIYLPPLAANLSEQVKALNIFSFSIFDSMSIEGSRGSYPYPLGEALRPKLNWETTKMYN
jgi:lipopolysaccharide transport system ATP-binding protein